jgi:DNA-binding MarR family transcriptional regulator
MSERGRREDGSSATQTIGRGGGKMTTMAKAQAETPDVAPASIQKDLGWALGTLLRAYLRQAGDAVAELPGGPRGYQVMSVVATGACQNQAAIAEQLGLDRTVMTYLLDDLEAQKLVVRTPDPVDRRSRRVTLTAKGRTLFATLAERVSQVERRILADLTDEEADQLRTTLGRAALVAEASMGDENTCQISESIDTTPPN